MPDGTVRGGFELSSEQALRSLTDIRDRGREADRALESLGLRMDRLSGRRVTPTIELRGLDRVNTQLTELEARLDRIGMKSTRIGISTNGRPTGGLLSDAAGVAGGGASTPTSGRAFSTLGGLGGRLPWWAPLLGAAPQLLGGAGALVGSAGSATLGAGTVGLGAFGPLVAGAGLTALVTKPAITDLQQVTKAQTAYNNAVQEFGRRSTQAATAARNLNLQVVQNPMALGAARQVAATRTAFDAATTAARGNVYSGISSVAFNARRALPTVGAAATAATGASAGAAGAFSGFLAQPGEQAMLMQLTGAFAQNLPVAERSLENIATTMLHLSVDAIPFFHEANVWVEHWTTGLASSTANSARVSNTMDRMVTSAKDWGRLGGAMVRDVRDLFAPAVGPGNSMVVSLTDSLNRWDVWLRDNPDKVRQFFRDGEQGVGRIATIISHLATDVWQIMQAVAPLLSRAEQFISFASGIGGGSLLAGGGLLYGAYEGARGALGGAGPSAGGALRGFLGGGGGGLVVAGGGVRGAGGAVVGATAAERTAFSGAGSYLLPRSAAATVSPTTSALELAAGGGLLLRAGAGARLANPAARGATAFEQAYGGIEGAHFAMPTSAVGTVPLAERGGLVGRLGQAGNAARGAVGGIARILLPLAGIQAAITAAGTGGGVPHAIGTGLATGASTLTLGTVSPQSFGNLLHAGFGTDNAGASFAGQGSQLRSLAAAASNVRTPAQLASITHQISSSMIGSEMSPSDQARLNTFFRRALATAAGNAGGYASNTWENAFTRGLDRGIAPQKAVAQMLSGMQRQVTALGPQGAKAFASDTARWVSQMEADNPKLQRPLERLMDGITKRINDMQDTTGSSFKDLQQKVFYFNGQILTGTQTTWNKIHDALVDPAQKAQEKLSGIWGTIQSEAVNSLTQMGYTRPQARQLVTAIEKGQVTTAQLQATTGSGQPVIQSNMNKKASGLATGGMISGRGLLDTVDLPHGEARVAPGEAWIANRHTMNALSSATIEKFGKTAWEMIRDEGRPHSAPLRFATGGTYSGSSLPLPRNKMMPGSWSIDMGVDIPAPAGTPEYAVGPGVIIQEGISGFGPNAPVLHITGGPLAGRNVYYGHAGPDLVRVGQHVQAGQQISEVGAGIVGISTGPHIEFGFGPPFGHGDSAAALLRSLMSGAGVAGIGSAGLGGGGGSAAPPQVHLRAPRSGLRGLPGVFADTASGMYAKGMTGKLNTALGALGASATGSTGSFSGTLSGPVEHQVYQYMSQAGFNKVAIAGMLGNAMQESSMNPNTAGGGLWQQISNFGGGSGGSLLNQMNRMLPQIAGLRGAMNAAGSPGAAAAVFEQGFERAGIPAMANRIRYANQAAAAGYSRGGGPVNWAGWNARGGTFITNGPTLFGAGEKGRETVTVSHGGAGGRAINITMNGVTFHGNDEHQLEGVAQVVAGKIMDALDRVSGGSDAQLAGVG